jgi:riboflavin synthase
MFTGIVEATGEIRRRTETDDGMRLLIACPFAVDLYHGQSVSVNGACLTVEDSSKEDFSVFLAEETVSRTYLGDLREGEAVNVERAMAADGRFDGHIVQGHVDGVGEIDEIEEVGEDWRFTFSLPTDLESYVVEKGSITIDGISLTVAGLGEGFSVAIIPTTYEETTLSTKEIGDPVHLEADVIAKYVEQVSAPYRDRTR